MVSLKTQLMATIKTRRSLKNSSEQGLTLLECLVAIVVIGVVAVTFTPPLILAIATREQNRRAEQASQLAQGELDRVRRLVEQGNYSNAQLPPVGNDNVALQSRPGGTTTDPSTVSASQGLLVDVNGDRTNDFLVQTFRSPGIGDQNGKIVVFRMGVRVYSAMVAQNLGALDDPPRRSASLQLTNALGQQRRLPLAAMYSTVVRSDHSNSLCNYRQFLGEDDRNIACR
jgi:prepilin-type N-terminal cleavage/methylation domain-containing protein